MRAKLIRVKTGHAAMKDVAVFGMCDYEPRVGMPFYMTASPRSACRKTLRQIETAPVTKVRIVRGVIHFEDRTNSYMLELLDDAVCV